MKNAIKALALGLMVSSLTSLSYAALDDGLGIKKAPRQPSSIKKSVKSKNSKRMVATKAETAKKPVVAQSFVKRSLGAVPAYIQRNWGALSQDQKEIVYSYHNENPYAKINKNYFKDNARPKPKYTHDNSAFGFDPNRQGDLNVLRADINTEGTEEMSAETKVVIDSLAALEAE